MKTALITGATGNLGSAVMEQFIKEGYQVIAVVSPGKEDQITMQNVEVVEVDLSDEREVEKTFIKLNDKYRLNAALFIAGGYHYGGLEDTDDRTLEKMFNINFKTAYFLAKKVFLHMKKNNIKGRMIFIGAKPALKAKAGKDSFAYALSKRLVFQLSDLFNAEGAPYEIVSTVIVPSIIDTPSNREAMPDADTGKWVKPEKIAKIMAFVCSENASPLRDTVIKVYGQS